MSDSTQFGIQSLEIGSTGDVTPDCIVALRQPFDLQWGAVEAIEHSGDLLLRGGCYQG